MKDVKETPLMKQYAELKAQYPDAILLFRVGDFYETFGTDAIVSSKILGIVLTKRANGAASHVELAGFPHHALDSYLPKLLKAGYRIAICEQLEDPKLVKGIVKRGITELVTPGAHYNNSVLEHQKNNYLAAVKIENTRYGLAFCDVSTGAFYTAEGSKAEAEQWLGQFNPAEVLFEKPKREALTSAFTFLDCIFPLDGWAFNFEQAYELLTRQWSTHSLKGFGLEAHTLAIAASGALLYYLNETKHQQLKHLAQVQVLHNNQFLGLDRFTLRNLELLEPQHTNGLSLMQSLDCCETPMGARMLRRWLAFPLIDKIEIENRLNITEQFLNAGEMRVPLKAALHQLGDMERLVSRAGALRCNPRELVQLKKVLETLGTVKALLLKTDFPSLQKLAHETSSCLHAFQLLHDQLLDEAPAQLGKGPVFLNGLHETLDRLQQLKHEGKQHLIAIQQREIQNTGISSLKIAFNSVFGYYLEVTHAHKDKVPPSWIRKQTLTNAERYITPELKTYEEEILGAEDRILQIEQELFSELCKRLLTHIPELIHTAQQMAQIDVLCNFAELAFKRKYCKPCFTNSQALRIMQGRHPVIETLLKEGTSYVANDIDLNPQTVQMMMITGPNMSGKSAVLRQTALIVIMAQMGCFVPAAEATLPITDRVFTRVGASDNISSGESTFMVEMNETASILHNISTGSLILMDEIGRGTSTYDGISIAWSIAKFLHDHPKRPKTLFATHYHELNSMCMHFSRIKNFNVSVKEHNNNIIFLRRLKEGGSAHSFGIHVAKMAGMPESVIRDAQLKLQELERHHHSESFQTELQWAPANDYSPAVNDASDAALELRAALLALNLNHISPMDALLILQDWQKNHLDT